MTFKETGIVRRIDDLGRVVIPREIRKQFHIVDGDALEIGIDASSRTVMFRPYSWCENTAGAVDRVTSLLEQSDMKLQFPEDYKKLNEILNRVKTELRKQDPEQK